MELHVINTGYFKLDGGAMFGVVPKSIWNKLNPADENNMCTWAMRCLLVEDGNRLILIDTGIGDKQDDKFFKHFYLHGEDSLIKSINEAGFSPDEITDVLLTHLHFDHVGGATKYNKDRTQIIPTFKNASYWSNQMHWEWAINPNAREKASFLKENIIPLQESGQLKFIEDISPFSNIDILSVDGHTEKQMIPVINTKEGKIAFAADLIPSTHHIRIPYIMSYDIRPLISMDEKQMFLKRAIDENFILFLEHDPAISCCFLIEESEGKIIIDKKFSCLDFFP